MKTAIIKCKVANFETRKFDDKVYYTVQPSTKTVNTFIDNLKSNGIIPYDINSKDIYLSKDIISSALYQAITQSLLSDGFSKETTDTLATSILDVAMTALDRAVMFVR